MTAKAISGTRRAFKELVDGTLRVQVDIDPEFRRDFLRMFPDIDTRVALAPIKAGAKAPEDDAPKGGELARLAGILCGNPAFQDWLDERAVGLDEAMRLQFPSQPDRAAVIVRKVCGVESRAELDHDENAAAIFHEQIRKPWAERNA